MGFKAFWNFYKRILTICALLHVRRCSPHLLSLLEGSSPSTNWRSLRFTNCPSERLEHVNGRCPLQKIRRPRRGHRRVRSKGRCSGKARARHSGALPCQAAQGKRIQKSDYIMRNRKHKSTLHAWNIPSMHAWNPPPCLQALRRVLVPLSLSFSPSLSLSFYPSALGDPHPQVPRNLSFLELP